MTERYRVEVEARDATGAPHTITGEVEADHALDAVDRAEDAAADVGLTSWYGGATRVPQSGGQ